MTMIVGWFSRSSKTKKPQEIPQLPESKKCTEEKGNDKHLNDFGRNSSGKN